MRVSVIGTGNVGVAMAADLSIRGHEVTLVKTSPIESKAYMRLLNYANRVCLKEEGIYTETEIHKVTNDLDSVKDAEVIIVTIQSTYHQDLFKRLAPYLNSNQVLLIVCSYMSSFYVTKYCNTIPMIAETTGPYLEGRIDLDDKPDQVVFRVGCRLSNSPLSVYQDDRKAECMSKLKELYQGFNAEYTVLQSALLNPNMVLHTVGAIMSIPRIEYSDGNFCMYREAYTRKNKATVNIMLQLDEEKNRVLMALGDSPVAIFDAAGFIGDPVEGFYSYAESKDRAVGPTSVHSRYITEDVSQGLVLLESIAKHIGMKVPVTTSLIDIASAALEEDFRYKGRTIQRLGCKWFIDYLNDTEKQS